MSEEALVCGIAVGQLRLKNAIGSWKKDMRGPRRPS